MRFVETAEPVDARQQIVGDAVHDLTDIAVHVGMKPAEIGDAGGGAHAAEKAVAFDEKRLPPERASGRSGGDAGGTAAEDDDLVVAEDRRLTRRLGDARHALPRQCSHSPPIWAPFSATERFITSTTGTSTSATTASSQKISK